MSHHVLGHVNRNELPAVMHGDRVTHKLRQDRRAPRPRANHFLLVRRVQFVDPLFEVRVSKRAFFYGTSHDLLLTPAIHNKLVRSLVVARLESARWLAPRSYRMPPARSLAFAPAVRVIDRVHRNAAIVRALAHPALAPGFAQRNILMIAVADRPDRRH